MCSENFKYPSDYSVAVVLGGSRVEGIWTGSILQGEVSKGCKWHFKYFKLNIASKKKTEWVLAGWSDYFPKLMNFFNLLGTCQLVNITQLV